MPATEVTNPRSPQYQSVPQSHLTPESLRATESYYLSLTHDFTPADFHELPLREVIYRAKEKKVAPSPNVALAVEFGIEMICALLASIHISVDPDQMRVIFLPEAVFNKLIGDNTTGGAMLLGLDEVFVKVSQDKSDLMLATSAFHELIHRWIDTMHNVFYRHSDEAQDLVQISIEPRRGGLEVKRIVRNSLTGELLDSGTLGTLINELGNFAYQQQFRATLLSNPTTQPLFADDLKIQNEKLQEIFGDSQNGTAIIHVSAPKGWEMALQFNSANLLWNRNGRLVMISSTMLPQLVEDLSNIVGPVEIQGVGDFNLLSALLYCKIYPQAQRSLQKAIDAKMGAGFYYRLRRVAYDSMEEIGNILKEVQNRGE